MKKIILIMVAFCLLLSGVGCSWMGKTVGKAQGKMERKVESFESGYQKGYKEETAKQ